jgi:fucose permease
MFGMAASPYWFILVFFAFIGGFAGIVDAGLNMYVAAYHSPQQMSWLHASFGIGITIGPLIMTYFLQQQIGWRGGYIFVGVVIIGIILLIALTSNEWRNEGFQTSENKPVRRANFAETVRVPAVWFTMATFTLYVGTEIGIGLWAYTIMVGRGIEPGIAGLWVSIYWGVFTGGRIFFGLIANRFKIDHVLRVCTLGMIIGTALFAWNVIPAVGFLGLIIVGGAQAPIFPMLMSNTAHRVGAEHAENSVSLQMGAVGIGGAVLPSLIGTFGRIYGLETMTILFFIVAILVFACHELTLLPRPVEPALSAED